MQKHHSEATRIEFTNPEDLKQFIYNFYYCNRSLKKAKLDYYPIASHFLSKLRRANKSTGYYVPGWLILSKLNGHYIVSKNGIKLSVSPIDHFKRSDLSAKIGDTVAIKRKYREHRTSLSLLSHQTNSELH